MAIRDELDAINEAFGAAFATQDAERLSAFYADDARLLFTGQPTVRGRDAVDATLRDMVASGPASLRFVTDEVVADGSLVIDIGRIVGSRGESKYVVVYRREADGSLRIILDAASSDGSHRRRPPDGRSVMRSLEVGLVLPTGDVFVDGPSPRWSEIRDLALHAERIGFDAVWVADELLWGPPEGPRQGFWECAATTGAVAAATSRIKVGTWILSALHRNPGITAKVVETLDEVSGGRFVCGLGAGHAGRQAHAFGLPEDHVVGRFEEAAEVIVPLLRGGHADYAGQFHVARQLEQRPVGPRPGVIPIMIGAKGPRMMRVAARYADTWSWFAEKRSDLDEFVPLLDALSVACAEVGRDPATIGRSAGIVVEPTPVTGSEQRDFGVPIRGSSTEIAD